MRALLCIPCGLLLWSCGSAVSDDLFADPGVSSGGTPSSHPLDSGVGGATLPFDGGSAGSGGDTSNSGGASSSAGAHSGGGDSGHAGGALGSGGASGTPGDAGVAGAGQAGARETPDAADQPAAQCPWGYYAGILSGNYRIGNGSTPITVDVTFEIDEQGRATGRLEGVGVINVAQADLEGDINCVTGRLVLTIKNGSYPTGDGTNRFGGTLTATYDARDHFPNGTWKITEPGSANGGQGSWSAE